MRKNVAGQIVGAQMITASDGSAFSGNVTVYVTGDGGTQALGTGSSPAGVANNEGNGFFTYAPAQAETNYEHAAFTFIGTGAIPVTIQVYPRVLILAEDLALQRGVQALVLGTVQSGASSTSIPTDLSETTADHFNGRVVTFTSGALLGQSTDITDYSAQGVLTVTALTEAPEPGVKFVIS